MNTPGRTERRSRAERFRHRVAACALGLIGAGGPDAVPAQDASPSPLPSAELRAPDAQAVVPTVVEVREYRVLGTSLLQPAEIAAAVTPFTGWRTVEELYRAAAAVQALYAEAGYGAVVVYLPPQAVSGGVITLQAIEGRLAAIRVVGSGAAFDEDNARASVPALKLGETPRLDLLDAQLRMANDNPAKRTRLVLLPGAQAEQTEAEIAVGPAAQRQFSLELDNSGAPGIGRPQMGLGWRDANLSGHDDVVDLRLQTALEHPDRYSAVSLSYRRPLYARATMLDAYALYANTRSERTPTAAGDLSFSGRGLLLGLRATRYLPRFKGLDRRLAISLERRDQRNQCAIGDLPEDACGSAGGDLVITPLALELSLLGDEEIPFALSASLVRGLALGDSRSDGAAFEAVRPGARPEFTLLRSELSAHRSWAAWDLGARLAAQWSADPLTPAMQFGAGGRSSVRGYEERELAADHGVAMSIELSAPPWHTPALADAAWRPLLFADAAALRNRGDLPCSGERERCHLASWGLGLRLQTGPLSASLDVARTLSDGGITPGGRTRAQVWMRFVH